MRLPWQGNFIATVKMTAPITLGVHTGLFYWVDDKNFIFLGPWGTRQDDGNFKDYIHTHYPAVRHPIFGKWAGGRWDPIPLKADALGNRKLKGEASSSEVWHLQLERSGAKYIGRMSVDGEQWTDIGTHVIAQKNGRIGLGAYQDWEKGNEQPAEFENFVVTGTK